MRFVLAIIVLAATAKFAFPQDVSKAEKHFLKGLAWLEKKEYDKAIADFNEVIRILPDNPTAYFIRGSAYHSKKEYDKAIADFSEVIRLDPKYVNAYINRANARLSKKEYDKAIADFNEAIRLDPKYALAYGNRGLAWNAKKEFDKAIADYTEAIRLDPKNAKLVHYSRGLVWSDKKEYRKAIADYEESLRLDPKYAPAFNGLAWLLATCPVDKLRDGKRAVALATEGLNLDKKDAAMMDTLAAAYAEAGNFDEAVRWQQEVLESPRFKNDADARSRLELYRKKTPYREK